MAQTGALLLHRWCAFEHHGPSLAVSLQFMPGDLISASSTKCNVNGSHRLQLAVWEHRLAALRHIREVHQEGRHALPAIHSVDLVMEVVKVRPVLLAGLHRHGCINLHTQKKAPEETAEYALCACTSLERLQANI